MIFKVLFSFGMLGIYYFFYLKNVRMENIKEDSLLRFNRKNIVKIGKFFLSFGFLEFIFL